MSSKRVLVISDTHCGHVAGLTPTAWQLRPTKGTLTKHNKWAKLQRELWARFTGLVEQLAPIDYMFHIGDCIDGDGYRSGGTEQITTDREEQADIAASVCNHVRLHARRGFKIVGVYGTASHTGPAEDFENIVADRSGWEKIGSHEWVDINGCVFDLKHHLGSSGIPHGRHTASAKEHLWSQLWSERGLTPKANVILRGHVHYHQFCGGPDWLSMTMPALQGMGSKYGARRCNGLVDWGVTHFDVGKDGSIEDWHAHCTTIKSQVTQAIKL